MLKRYEAYGWHVDHVPNGDDDLAGIHAAIERAKAIKDRPSLIKVTTTIGFGSGKQGTLSSNYMPRALTAAGTEGVHGSPLGDEDVANVKTKFG